ncbi:hypothetical protein RJ639_017288, partial [Escallonia herrerae]
IPISVVLHTTRPLQVARSLFCSYSKMPKSEKQENQPPELLVQQPTQEKIHQLGRNAAPKQRRKATGASLRDAFSLYVAVGSVKSAARL